jgi:hypothetical protein
MPPVEIRVWARLALSDLSNVMPICTEGPPFQVQIEQGILQPPPPSA